MVHLYCTHYIPALMSQDDGGYQPMKLYCLHFDVSFSFRAGRRLILTMQKYISKLEKHEEFKSIKV